MPGFKIFGIRDLAFVHAINWPVLIHRMFDIWMPFPLMRPRTADLRDGGTEIE
jgi:hypothetical protein